MILPLTATYSLYGANKRQYNATQCKLPAPKSQLCVADKSVLIILSTVIFDKLRCEISRTETILHFCLMLCHILTLKKGR